MGILCRWILVLTLLPAAGARLWAASAADRAFDAAAKAFHDNFYDRAEPGFAEFSQKFPTSPRLAEAILLQAEARLELTNYGGAIELLSAHLGAAGTNADQYVFWLAEAYARKGDYRAASDGFARVIKEFPASSRCLEAAVGEASARALLARAEPSEWARVIELLQQTNGVFQAAVRANSGQELVPRGCLLLSEAQLATKNYRGAEETLQPLAKRLLDPRTMWQWQYLLCRIQLADGRTNSALQGTTNLWALATNAGQTNLQADSAAFHAGLLEHLGQTNEAIAVYQKNLAEGIPNERVRQALLKITELSLAQGRERIPQATQMLEKFVAQYPDAAAADLALLTLGELHLRQYEAGADTNAVAGVTTSAPAATNGLPLAMTSFSELVKRFPRSELFGKAQLDLGRCYVRAGKLPEAQAAFQLAVERLPLSLDLGSAYLRLADVQFEQGEVTNATRNYQTILEKLAALPEAKTNLFERALYQTVRAGLAGGDWAAATNSLQKLRAWYPNSLNTEWAVLLSGQEISRRGEPARARAMLLEFAQRVPEPSLLAELQLAIAGTYEQENQWTNAIEQYARWLARFTNSSARPQAEYYRAQATYLAGQETNALMLFTNFIAQFPTNDLAPQAQLWIADYCYSARDWLGAERNYKLLFQSTNWLPSKLTYEAQLMAGRAAAAHQGWKDAKDYFLGLYNNTNGPSINLRVQAFFEYGQSLMQWVEPAETNKLANCEEATRVFGRICDDYPTNRLAVPAWIEKANCYLQWALVRQQYDSLTNAINAFQRVIDSPQADVAARSEAKVGQAVTLEKWAAQKSGAEQTVLLKQALSNCLDVVYGNILRDDERLDPTWTQRAAKKGFEMAEAMQTWSQAVSLYQRLTNTVWPLQDPFLDKRAAKARENLEREKTSR
jgi:TolA-binding protein